MSTKRNQIFRRQSATFAFAILATVASVASTAALTHVASDGGLATVLVAASDASAGRASA